MDYDISDEWQTEAGLSVHAGFPNPAADSWLPTLDFNQLLIRHPSSTFSFRIRADMGKTAEGCSGDIAVVDRAEPYHDHDVVLWHDGQRFRLSRAKQVDPETQVWGVVTAIIRELRRRER